MNTLKEYIAELSRLVLKSLLLPFLLSEPKIVGSVNALPDIIKSNHCDKVLIITDAGIRKLI